MKKGVYPDPETLVYKIAERYSWTIIPSANIVLNELGLSTQVPSVYSYISSGPHRVYNYLGFELKFKQTSSRNISNFSIPLLKTIQAMIAFGKENISTKNKRLLSEYIETNVKDDIVNDAKNIPTWIYSLLTEMQRENQFDE